MTVMSLVLRPLNHDKPEPVSDFAAYYQGTDQPENTSYFENHV
jgi:hypothetical protein